MIAVRCCSKFRAMRPIDFRYGHDRFAAKAQEVLRLDPFSGAAFVFRSIERTASRFWSRIEPA
jgi:transposase